MKKALVALLSIVVSLSAFADDTIIYKPVVTLDSDFSVYDSVVVVAIDSIVLEAGFKCSANATSSLYTISSPFHIDEPDLTMTPGTAVEPSGTLDGGYLVGTIKGQHGVSPSGAATYSIPIALPAGNLGMVPQLSVGYNSQSGNGIMGRGWNLGGLSSIAATGMNRYYDNESTAISSEDTVCRVVWNGQRLLALNNAGLEADSFRTEMLSNVKITTTGSENTMWFTVKTPNGRTMEYGSSTDSRLKLGDETQWKWMLNKVYDRNGNTIEYTYSKDESIGELLLSKIEYGSDTTSLVNSITFHYTTRADISHAYIHDDLVLNDQLLDSISIESNSEYYGSYGFTYDDSMDESLLDEIVQYDRDNYRFNSTTVSWEEPLFFRYAIPTSIDMVNGDELQHFSGDFTGDGIDDIVAVKLDINNDEYKYYLYEGSSSGLPSPYTETGDLPRSYTHIYWNELTSLFDVRCTGTASSTFGKKDISYVFSGDFDGDGIEELFVKVVEWDALAPYLPEDLNSDFDHFDIIHGNGYYNVVCNDSSFFENPNTTDLGSGIGRILNLDESGTPGYTMHSFMLGTSSSYDKQRYQFPDLEGFGYNCIPDQDSLYYYHSGLDTMLAYVDIPDNTTFWGEMNGDGKADYISGSSIKTYRSSTNSYTTSGTVSGAFLGMIDLNGDGTNAWVGITNEQFEIVALDDLWDEWCPDNGGCDLGVQSVWNIFLAEYDLGLAYFDYWFNSGSCPGGDDEDCRADFLEYGGSIQLSLGHELYMEHLSDRGPEVSLGFFPSTDESIDTILTMAVAVDINADQSNDLLVFNLDTLKKIYYDFEPSYSNGTISYTYSTRTYSTLLDERVKVGDYNGDGIMEMIFPDAEKKLDFITSGKSGKLVSSITNGLGIESSYTYKPLTDTSVYTKESDASYPVIDFSAPWYVVSSVAADNGVADSTYIEYEYEGAKIHLQGKGFLGFMKTTVENDLQSRSHISSLDYNTDYFQTYPLTSVQKSGTNSVAQSSSYVSFDSLDVHYFKMQTDSVKNQDFLSGTTSTSGFTYYSNGLLSEKKTKFGTLATVTENYMYTEAGWHVAALPEYISREYKRGNESATDSSFLSYDDSTGNLIQKKEYCGTDREMITKITGYDSWGNPERISVTGKRGPNLAEDSVWTDMCYSSDGRFLTSKSGPLDYKVTYQYDLSMGVLESQTAPNRKEAMHEYGPFLGKKKSIGSDNVEAASAILWASDRTADSIAGALFYKWSIASGTPEVVTYYDEVGRELRTVAVGFDDELIYNDTEYNAKGQVYRKSLPYFSENSPLWTTFTYDSYGRISKDSSANSIVTTYTYSGLETQISVSDGDSTYTSSKTVNALGETIESTDDADNTVCNLYYPDGKLFGSYVSTHDSDTTLFEYDAQGNRTSIEDPDAGTITSLYDGFGSLLMQVNAKGDTTSYLYDEIGRVTKQTDARGDIHFSYISDTTKAAFGMVDSVYNSDRTLQEVISYDTDYGRLIGQTKKQPGKTFTNSYTYDWYGRPMTRTYPSGFEIDYTYTSNGDLDQVRGEGLTLWNCSDVNALGQITDYSQGTYSTSVSYDDFGKLNRVATGSIVDMCYNFNDFGNLVAREDSISLQEEKFSYDNLNRLTKIEYYNDDTYVSTADLSMGYDNCGNITSKTNLSTDIDYGEGMAGPHAITTINDPDVSYVPVPQSITYNCFNKVSLITDTLSGGIPLTLDFTYGLNNQRIKTSKSRNSTIERVKYFDMDYEEDSTSSGVKKYHYIHGGNGLTAIFVKEGTGSDTMYHVLSDHLGSLTTIVNTTSNEVTSYSFNAWGIPRDATDWESAYAGELFAGRGYTGHEHLSEFNLINMNGRIYDPILGRFLSPDPYVQMPGYPNNFNRYSYVLNNPLKFIDPTGYEINIKDIAMHLWQCGGGNYSISADGSIGEFSANELFTSYSGGQNSHGPSGGGVSGSWQPVFGGGSFSLGLMREFDPAKQRDVLIWKKQIFDISLSKITGYKWVEGGPQFEFTPVSWSNFFNLPEPNFDFRPSRGGGSGGASSRVDGLTRFLTNQEPWAKLSLATKRGIGVAKHGSLLGFQAGGAIDIYSIKRSGFINTAGVIESNEYKTSSGSAYYGFLGFSYERNWTDKSNIFELDLGPIHIETGEMPTLRLISGGYHVFGGLFIDVDLNLGRIMGAHGKTVMKTRTIPVPGGYYTNF